MKIEGFDYNSFDRELVQQILELYVEGAGYKTIAESGLPVSFASAQRIVLHAISLGVIAHEQKHGVGTMPSARNRAKKYLNKFPTASPKSIARLAGCAEATVYRAKNSE